MEETGSQHCKSICLGTRIEFCFSQDKHYSAARKSKGQEEEKEEENPS